ncbi:hypothetical protein TeGR_g8249, partial [Tetraparma gracilis]
PPLPPPIPYPRPAGLAGVPWGAPPPPGSLQPPPGFQQGYQQGYQQHAYQQGFQHAPQQPGYQQPGYQQPGLPSGSAPPGYPPQGPAAAPSAGGYFASRSAPAAPAPAAGRGGKRTREEPAASPKPEKPAVLPAAYRQPPGFRTVAVDVGGSVQRFDIVLGDSPADVAAWREARRKRWPSAANVADKRRRQAREAAEKGERERREAGRAAVGTDAVERAVARCLSATGLKPSAPSGAAALHNTQAKGGAPHCTQFLARGCLRGSLCELVHDPGALRGRQEGLRREAAVRDREARRLEG